MKKLLLIVGLLIGFSTYGQKPETPVEYIIHLFTTELNGIEIKRDLVDGFGSTAVVVEVPDFYNKQTVVAIIQGPVINYRDIKFVRAWYKMKEMPNTYMCIIAVEDEIITISYFEDLSHIVFFYKK